MNWSGGRDSSLCLHKILQDERYSVDSLLTSVNAAHDRISDARGAAGVAE